MATIRVEMLSTETQIKREAMTTIVAPTQDPRREPATIPNNETRNQRTSAADTWPEGRLISARGESDVAIM
jgi:hypothetical protein